MPALPSSTSRPAPVYVITEPAAHPLYLPTCTNNELPCELTQVLNTAPTCSALPPVAVSDHATVLEGAQERPPRLRGAPSGAGSA